MLNVLNQETFGAHTVNEMLWGYNDTLFKLAKDIMPPEHVLPHDMFGLLAGVSIFIVLRYNFPSKHEVTHRRTLCSFAVE